MRVFKVEVHLEVLSVINRVIFAGNYIVKPLALLMAFECGLVEFVIDCLVLLVINELMQDGTIFQRLFLIVITLKKLFFGSGQVYLSLELIFFVVLVLLLVGLGFWLQI